MHISVAVVNK